MGGSDAEKIINLTAAVGAAEGRAERTLAELTTAREDIRTLEVNMAAINAANSLRISQLVARTTERDRALADRDNLSQQVVKITQALQNITQEKNDYADKLKASEERVTFVRDIAKMNVEAARQERDAYREKYFAAIKSDNSTKGGKA